MSSYPRMVELPPIGLDGHCTACGALPSRETGRCRCVTIHAASSATVDAARAALVEALAGNRDAPVIDRLNDFEAAVDSAAREEAYRQGYDSAMTDTEAKLPTDTSGWSFEGLTGDGWAIIGPDDEERHGDWSADGYGRAIALDREDAVRIVNALNGRADSDERLRALREALRRHHAFLQNEATRCGLCGDALAATPAEEERT